MGEERPLNGQDVTAVYALCHVDMDDPDPDDAIERTLFRTERFFPGEIEYRIGFIRRSLAQLPEEFQRAEGAAFRFGLNNRDGVPWSWVDETEELEMLLMMGMAAGLVELVPSSELLPFIRVNLNP